MPEFTQLESEKSMIRYLPPKGIAGFARLRVRCRSRSPRPPAMTTAIVLLVSWLTKRPDFRGFTGGALSAVLCFAGAAAKCSITRAELRHYDKLADRSELLTTVKAADPSADREPRPAPDPGIELLLAARHHDPFAVLGRHPLPGGGYVVRVFRPATVWVELPDIGAALERVGSTDLFEYRGDSTKLPDRYRVRWRSDSGVTMERVDAYCFPPQLLDSEIAAFNASEIDIAGAQGVRRISSERALCRRRQGTPCFDRRRTSCRAAPPVKSAAVRLC